MTKTFSRLLITSVAAASVMFAAPVNDSTVTLPHAVTVGSTTLPSGTYTLTPIEMKDGAEYFVVRGEKTEPVVLSTQKSEESAAATKSGVTLSGSGENWHFDKVLIEGQNTSYELAQ